MPQKQIHQMRHQPFQQAQWRAVAPISPRASTGMPAANSPRTADVRWLAARSGIRRAAARCRDKLGIGRNQPIEFVGTGGHAGSQKSIQGGDVHPGAMRAAGKFGDFGLPALHGQSVCRSPVLFRCTFWIRTRSPAAPATEAFLGRARQPSGARFHRVR